MNLKPVFNLTDPPFYTLQGEGYGYGVPSIFIRFSGCNLRCVWRRDDGDSICDTPYSSFKPEQVRLKLEDLESFVETHPLAEQLVITGGEPLMWPTQIESLYHRFSDDYRLTIETNGTLLYKNYINCDRLTLSISPKITTIESTPASRLELAHQIINSMTRNPDTKHVLKFVVHSAKDEHLIKEFLHLLPCIDRHQVLLMPEGTTSQHVDNLSTCVAEMALTNGWRYTDRLHLRLWQGRRNT